VEGEIALIRLLVISCCDAVQLWHLIGRTVGSESALADFFCAMASVGGVALAREGRQVFESKELLERVLIIVHLRQLSLYRSKVLEMRKNGGKEGQKEDTGRGLSFYREVERCLIGLLDNIPSVNC